MTSQNQPPQTAAVLVYLSRQVGFLDAIRVLSFLAEWAVAMKANEWEPIDDIEEFGVLMRMSRASAYRRQALYRRAFPWEGLPNEQILAAREVWLRELPGTDPTGDDLASLVAVLPAA